MKNVKAIRLKSIFYKTNNKSLIIFYQNIFGDTDYQLNEYHHIYKYNFSIFLFLL
jgi:uncharacterized glyoxalase superfamily protein PhnB